MRKICIIVPAHWDAFKGGAEYQADCLADYMSRTNKYNVIYLARDVAETKKNHQYTISKIPILFRNVRFGLFWDAFFLYRKLKQASPDVILQHVGCAYTGIAAYYCKKNRKKMVWLIASDVDVEKKKMSLLPKKIPLVIDDIFLKYGINNADIIVSQTNKQAKLIEKHYGRKADYVIPNFHPPCKNTTITKGEQLNVIWVANIKRLKQPEIFIKLAKDCIDFENISFSIIGRRQDSEWCDILLKEVKDLKNIKYIGELDIDSVNDEFEKAHILVNTSVYEGFPNTFIQAWMREAPTLSLNVDPDGVIQEHALGLHAGSYENMKSYILDMNENRNKLGAVGKRARKFAEENYSMKNADRLIATFNTELANL